MRYATCRVVGVLQDARSSPPASGTRRGGPVGRFRGKNVCPRDDPNSKRRCAARRGEKTLEREERRHRTHGPDARARATTSFDTPSSGGASVPSRIRPESTVRETPHPVTRALSSSKPRSLSVARIPTFSRLRGVLVDRAQARACARHETRRTACTRSTSRLVAMRAPAGARAPHQATGAPASFLRRPFLTGPHAACLGCRAIFSYESTSVIFSLCMTLPGAGASFCG